jgi:hypothetical protein
LDGGKELWIWNGTEANRIKKAKGVDVASRIKNKERGGSAKVFTVESERDYSRFYSLFGIDDASTVVIKSGILFVPLYCSCSSLEVGLAAQEGGDDTAHEKQTDSEYHLFRLRGKKKKKPLCSSFSKCLIGICSFCRVENNLSIKEIEGKKTRSLLETEYTYVYDGPPFLFFFFSLPF